MGSKGQIYFEGPNITVTCSGHPHYTIHFVG